MSKYLNLGLLFCLQLLSGCATQYLIPGNRFITPETQGEAFRGQFEFQQTSGNQLTVNTVNGSVDEGVLYSEIYRSGFLFSNSFFDKFDFVWSHMGAANSMIGGKFQFVGGSRVSKTAGHKLALTVLFGGNEHETDDKSVEYELSGKEYMFLYGYRINENVLPYASLSMSTYDFSGIVRSSNPALNGLRPEFSTTIYSANGGVEFAFEAFFAKLEATYQQLNTKETKVKDRIIFGYSLGFSW